MKKGNIVQKKQVMSWHDPTFLHYDVVEAVEKVEIH